MIIKATNPWGVKGGLDHQRSDLWVADLSSVINGITFSNGSANNDFVLTSKNVLPRLGNGNKHHVICSVNLPAKTIKPEAIRRDAGLRYNEPGADEVVEACDMAIYIDAAPDRSSRVINTFYRWYDLSRAGRDPVSTGNPLDAVPLKADLSFENAAGREVCLFDIPVYMISGHDDTMAIDAFDNSGLFNTGYLTSTQAFMLKECWLGYLKVDELNFNNSAALKLSIKVFPKDVRPVPVEI